MSDELAAVVERLKRLANGERGKVVYGFTRNNTIVGTNLIARR